MKLLSLTLANYRIHKNLQIEFDPAMTVITGTNETGKSTVVEAISNVFFLRHRGDSAQHRAMQSELHPGTPEVTLKFEAEGRVYEIYKSFTRTRMASARLAVANGQTWPGDQAESELSRIIAQHGQGLLESLFVRQGEQSADPTDGFRELPGLTQRLRNLGGAILVATDEDEQTLQQVREVINRNLTARGPAVGGPLRVANDRADHARAGFLEAESRFNQLLNAERAYQQAKQTIAEQKPLLERNKKELAETDLALEKVTELTSDLKQKKASLDAANRRCTDLATQLYQLQTLLTEKQTIEAQLSPLKDELKTLNTKANEASQRLDAARVAADEAEAGTRTCRLELDYADAHRERFGLNKKLEAFQRDQNAAVEWQQKKSTLECQLAALPAVTDKKLRAIENAEIAANVAQAKLDAMGAQITVLAAGIPVVIDSRQFGAGDKYSLSAETELSYGPDLKLKISPGTNGELSDAKAELDAAKATFKNLLQALVITTTQQAREIYEERRKLDGELQLATNSFQQFDLAQLESEIKRAGLELVEISQRIERLQSQIMEPANPANLDEATEQVSQLRNALAEAEFISNKKKGEQTAAEKAVQLANQVATKLQTDLTTLNSKLDQIIGQLTILEGAGGEAVIKTAIQAALAETQTHTAAVSQLESDLEALQPDTLTRRKTRLTASITNLEQLLTSANEAVYRQLGAMQRTEEQDPEGELRQAKAAMDQANRRLSELQLQVRALQRINALYDQLRTEAAESQGRQLAKKIQEYVKELYGPNAMVQIKMEGNQFRKLSISRPGLKSVAFDFNTLSGGTMEQVAAAAKLALAELMLQGDEMLPVVLDDSFANTDILRIERVKDMLTLANDRGLQLIVLSCNLADFNGLGGRLIRLEEQVLLGNGPNQQAASGLADQVGDDRGGAVQNRRRASIVVDLEATEEALENDEDELGELQDDFNVVTTVTDQLRGDFISALRNAGGSSGNISLKRRLEWADELYDAVKNDLINRGQVEPGGGRGGSVTLLS